MTIRTALHEVADAIGGWAGSDPCVRACFWFGGFARERLSPESDIDVALLLLPETPLPPVLASLTRVIEEAGIPVTHAVLLPSTSSATLWVGPRTTKVDVVLTDSVAGIGWIADAADVPAPRLVLASDVEDADIADLLRRARIQYDATALDPRRMRAEEEIDKFLVAFDACSAAHTRGDAYAFYFHYDLALGRLLRLVQLTRGGARYLYLPRDLLATAISGEEQREIYGLAASFALPEGIERKRALAERFEIALGEAQDVLGVERDAARLTRLLSRIERRDLLYNVRDLATYARGHVRSGVLLRGPSLSRWGDRVELVDWIEDRRITDIVDLRSTAEIEAEPHPDRISGGLNIHRVPMSIPDEPDASPSASMLPAIGEALAHLIEVIVGAQGATMVHCAWGRDRTGWVCALLLDMLGVSDAAIERDYLASRMGTQPNAVRGLLRAVRADGGAAAFAERSGVELDRLRALKLKLCICP